MQCARRTNRQRSDETRSALLAAARRLFIEQGYADTSTPQVVVEAGVSRGALYHQFDDKQALFRAVVSAEAEAVADAINATALSHREPRAKLLAGVHAYLRAMRQPGRCKLLLVEAPVVLGSAEMREIDLLNGGRTLTVGLQDVLPAAESDQLAALADMLSAAFDRAALAIEQGAEATRYDDAVVTMLQAVVDGLEPRAP